MRKMNRIKKFNKAYPNGAIQVVRVITDEPTYEIAKATVIPDVDKPERSFTSYAKEVNDKSGAFEIAQSRAIDLALFLLLQ